MPAIKNVKTPDLLITTPAEVSGLPVDADIRTLMINDTDDTTVLMTKDAITAFLNLATSASVAALEDARIDTASSTGRVENGSYFLDFALSDGGAASIDVTPLFSALVSALNSQSSSINQKNPTLIIKDGSGNVLAQGPTELIIQGAGATVTADGTVVTVDIDAGGPIRANWVFSTVDLSTLPNLVGHWDFSDSASLTLNGSTISQLTDKSATAAPMVQAVTVNQPTLLSSYANGLSVANFDGIDDFMTANSAGSVLDGTDSPFSVYAVLGSDELAATMVALGFGSSLNTTVGLYLGTTSGGFYNFHKRSGSSINSSLPVEADGKMHLIAVIHNGLSTDIWVDGYKCITGFSQNVSAIACDLLTLGAWTRSNGTSFFFNGVVGEVAVFAGLHDDASIKSVSGHLMKKWFDVVPNTDFVFSIGQSNMVGKAETTYAADLPTVLTGDGVKWDSASSAFIPIRDPIGDNFPKGGCLYSFARDWRAATGRSVCIVQEAKGATSLIPASGGASGTWKHDEPGSLYPAAVSVANNGLSTLSTDSIFSVNQIIVLWAQGETDAGALDAGTAGVDAATYEAFLTALFNALGTDLSTAPDLILVSELGFFNGTPDKEPAYAAIRAAQSAACTAVSVASVAFSGAKNFGVSGMSDTNHYTQISYNAMGSGLVQGGSPLALDPVGQ